MASAQGTKPGTMLRWLIEHGNLTNKTTEEADRLLPLLASEGFNTTKLSVIQALGVARRIKGLPPPVRPGKKQPYRTGSRQAKRQVQQNPRVEALGSFVDDALKGLQMLKGELRRLKDIEKKYNAIKAQFEA
jgi:hypothetical protein